jgi:membrane protein
MTLRPSERHRGFEDMNSVEQKPWASVIVRARAKLGGAYTWGHEFWRQLDSSRTTGLAAEMAFWLFLSLLPLAAVAGLVAARVAVESSDVARLLASLPVETRDLIKDQLGQVAAWRGGSVGASATAVFVWLASGGVHAIFDLLEVKAGCARPWWRKRLIAIGTCLALSVGVALIALLGTGLDAILTLVHGAVPLPALVAPVSMLEKVIRFAIGLVTAVGLVAGLYWVGVPRKGRANMTIFPGALLAVGLQVLSGYGYVFYLSKAGTGSAYQASLAIVAVTMIALYLFALALLIGAHLNHLIAMSKGRSSAVNQASEGETS